MNYGTHGNHQWKDTNLKKKSIREKTLIKDRMECSANAMASAHVCVSFLSCLTIINIVNDLIVFLITFIMKFLSCALEHSSSLWSFYHVFQRIVWIWGKPYLFKLCGYSFIKTKWMHRCYSFSFIIFSNFEWIQKMFIIWGANYCLVIVWPFFCRIKK